MKPGWIENLSNNDYHAIEGMSGSQWKYVEPGPEFLEHKRNAPEEDKDEYVVGRAAHTLILEPHKFFDKYQMLPKGKKRMQTDKDAALKLGFELLKPDEMAMLKGMKDSVYANEHARSLIEMDGPVEKSGCWLDPTWGFPTRVRPDKFIPEIKIVTDLKTIASRGQFKSLDDLFERQIGNLGYHYQAVHNMELVSQLENEQYNNFAWIVVMKSPPYLCKVFYASREMIIWTKNRMATLREVYNDYFYGERKPEPKNEYSILNLKPWDMKG